MKQFGLQTLLHELHLIKATFYALVNMIFILYRACTN